MKKHLLSRVICLTDRCT